MISSAAMSGFPWSASFTFLGSFVSRNPLGHRSICAAITRPPRSVTLRNISSTVPSTCIAPSPHTSLLIPILFSISRNSVSELSNSNKARKCPLRVDNSIPGKTTKPFAFASSRIISTPSKVLWSVMAMAFTPAANAAATICAAVTDLSL